MADRPQHYPTQPQPQTLPHPQRPAPPSHQFVKAATALTAGGSSLLLSGLTLVGTVIALTVATPLLVIFSPVLVPAAITVVLLLGGFVTSGGFGLAAVSLLSWLYKFVKGQNPPGADQLEDARRRIEGKAREMKDYGQQHLTGSQAS